MGACLSSHDSLMSPAPPLLLRVCFWEEQLRLKAVSWSHGAIWLHQVFLLLFQVRRRIRIHDALPTKDVRDKTSAVCSSGIFAPACVSSGFLDIVEPIAD